MRKFVIFHILLFLITAVFSKTPWPFIMLSVAQLVYIPIMLRLVCTKRDWFWKGYSYFAVPAYVSVIIGQLTSTALNGLLAAVYLLFTFFIASYGVFRFLHRGFTNLEEFAIDLGLIYIAMGGGWYFAYMAGINTGFTPLVTWLTAIHFHYSAFLLPIFTGLLGRMHSTRLYRSATAALLAAPIAVAVGITFSKWIEVGSVLLYFYGLAVIICIVWKQPFLNQIQKWLVRVSFSVLAVTISFSLLYVGSNGFGLFSFSIDFMLRFHGVLNCAVFALAGIIGWMTAVPEPRFLPPNFPVSKLRGRQNAEQIGAIGVCRGLSDDLHAYGGEIAHISPEIIDFYENTTDYRLFASVHWKRWFKPFAYVYSLLSKQMQQINLPVCQKEVEMTGNIFTLHENLDGREAVRAWERRIGEQTVFTALYSQHTNDGSLFMNIALPLPFTTMTGILELRPTGKDLQLTSTSMDTAKSDAGIYLSVGKNGLCKLPLTETFLIQDKGCGHLQATHRMQIFSLPFLTIDYKIVHNRGE